MRHRVHVGDFWIERDKVTDACVDVAGGRAAPIGGPIRG
jgi:hypothetical protein